MAYVCFRHAYDDYKGVERGLFKIMKNIHQKFRRWVAGTLDLPQDVMLDLPRITMIGPVQMYVENHRGLLLFNQNELRLLLSNKGELIVKGKQFVIRQILPEEVLLEGKIEDIRYVDNERD